MINDDRTKSGLAALAPRDDLDDLAAGHSADMAAARRIFHNDQLFTEATKKRIGAKTVGENVASNTSIDEAHRRLMNSPSHRANLLSSSFTRLGLGLVDADGTWYVTEVFVTPVASAAASAAAPAVAAGTSAPAARATIRSTTPRATRATTPRATRGLRPATNTGTSLPSAEVVPADAPAGETVAVSVDVAPEVPVLSELVVDSPIPSQPSSTSTAPASMLLPAVVALALLLASALGVTRIMYRKRTNRPMADAGKRHGGESTTWHPFSWLTISPMSGS